MAPNEFGVSGTAPFSQPLPSAGECDVKDFSLLMRYREERAKWLGWYAFRQDDPNSITGQIMWMIFSDMSYRMLAKPRVGSAASSLAVRNHLLGHMLDQGYAATQILAIRRLLDRRGDVHSLQRLLCDIQKSRDIITRENFVAYDGKPYDPDGGTAQRSSLESRIFGIEAPGFYPWLISGVRHAMFDKLSGVSKENRSRVDTIQTSIFEKLQAKLRPVEAKNLIILSNKFFAHAADVETRDSLTYSGVLLGNIEAAQKAIVQVERTITDDILMLGNNRDVVAMPPLGFLEFLDAPYVETATLAKMDEHWDALKAERESWSKGYASDLYSE